MNHCGAATLASMITTKLHFNHQFHPSKPVYGRENRVRRKNTKNKGSDIVAVNIISMRKKREHKNMRSGKR